jgi:hypothetical protein
MTELTEREKQIICIDHFIMSPELNNLPSDILVKSLHRTLKSCYRIDFSGEELQELVNFIKEERERIMNSIS